MLPSFHHLITLTCTLQTHTHTHTHTHARTHILTPRPALSAFPGRVLCWTYNSSTQAMSWSEARNFCQGSYTDLVAIQSEEETAHLLNITHIIPHRDSMPHYWIGMRKINGTWTWVGTERVLTGNGSWAPDEPNNNKDDEDCVQIYIHNQPGKMGKWNDAKCSDRNWPICYKAQCTRDACYGHGECVEVINSFKCLCHPGFDGTHCKTAVQCRKPVVPQNGSVECCGPHGNLSVGATCRFSCGEGFRREGLAQITCNATGQWSGNEPACSVLPPSLSPAPCEHLREPAGGVMMCSEGTCSFHCQPGFLLLGSTQVTCQPANVWSGFRPVCASYSHLLLAVLGWNVLTAACCLAYCCQNQRRSKGILCGACSCMH
ncbi:hypothetical protein ACEWY4_014140 [Coilia grayii]|uniref:E-selectin n=1 Tax=Coilia grayii TaxID=363190 RepID=A0ABD1JRG3_9TELE